MWKGQVLTGYRNNLKGGDKKKKAPFYIWIPLPLGKNAQGPRQEQLISAQAQLSRMNAKQKKERNQDKQEPLEGRRSYEQHGKKW